MKKQLFAALLTAAVLAVPSFAADPVDTVNVVNKDAIVDGVVESGEWDDATKLTLNISDTGTWSVGGAGIVGDPDAAAAHSDSDITNSIRLMIKDGYLYYLEERTDSTPFFGAVDTRKPYTQDSTLIWFINGSKRNSLSVLAANDSSDTPLIYFNENDDQPNGVLLDAEATATIGSGFVLEAKIALSDIGFTEDEFKSGDTYVTYCCVNIYDSDFSGDSAQLWAPYGYQLQYIGVNTWDLAPVINVVEQTTFVEPEPEETAPPEEIPANESPVEAAPSTDPAAAAAPQTSDAFVLLTLGCAAAIALAAVIAKKRSAK